MIPGLIGRRQGNAPSSCTAIDHARPSYCVAGKTGEYPDSKAGRVARAGKLVGSLETQAAARRLDASCRNTRRRRPASDELSRPRQLARKSTRLFRSLLVLDPVLQHIATIFEAVEDELELRMPTGRMRLVRHEILFGNVGDIR